MITQKDIAAQAGLSVATVSDILNGRKGVRYGEETVLRVHEISQRLGYRRDRLASALRGGKSSIVGVIVPDMSNPYVSSLLKRFMMRLRAEGFEIVVAELDAGAEDNWKKTIEELTALRLDGLLLLLPETPCKGLLDTSTLPGVSVIVHGVAPGSPDIDAVEINYEPAVRRLSELMVSLGHERILLLDDTVGTVSLGPRLSMVCKELLRSGIKRKTITSLFVQSSAEAANIELGEYLDVTPKTHWPTAIIAANDLSALGAMRACQERLLKIPSNISVVAFDNTSIGSLLYPSLTSIGVQILAIADRISNRMVTRLKTNDLSMPPLRLTVEAHLLLRESLGAASHTTIDKVS